MRRAQLRQLERLGLREGHVQIREERLDLGAGRRPHRARLVPQHEVHGGGRAIADEVARLHGAGVGRPEEGEVALHHDGRHVAVEPRPHASGNVAHRVGAMTPTSFRSHVKSPRRNAC
eukprot:7002792-Prymnesium_polylepis.2